MQYITHKNLQSPVKLRTGSGVGRNGEVCMCMEEGVGEACVYGEVRLSAQVPRKLDM